jgi:penicillin-binding protein 1C
LPLAAFALDRAFPPNLARLTPSPIVEDRHGAMLRAFETADQQWRLAADPDRVSQNYLRLLVAIEDKRFWHHPGVDPAAMVRALGQLVTHGRIVSGGSTLTMQVVRLLEPRPRTLRSKIIEMARALQLEARMTKRDILAAYLTLTPMGGNLEGVRAGSLAWLGKEPKSLSDAEAALLVALPQAPRANQPSAYPARATWARNKIVALARDAGVLKADAARAALATPLPTTRRPLPRLAPHLAEELVAADPAPAPIRTALDATIQASVERVLRQTLDALPRPVNVAAIVADWHTGEIFARAGSGDYADARRSGAIDMTRTLRSPGSTLKPFIYGMAFDGLLAHPDSLVRDEPTRFDDYAPHNFDGGFSGDVTVRRALQASLNLPAVVTLQRVGPIAFAARFRDAGLPLAFDDDHVVPSLPIALGGVGISLERLVTAYAALADGGRVKPLVDRADTAPPARSDARLLNRAGADAVVDILAGMPPPKGLATRSGGIAYKTGTSYRFRDGWAVGFDGTRVIGVWMGRADGGTCVTCVGMASAGILFRLFDQLAPAPLPPRTLTPVFAGPPPAALRRLTTAAQGPRTSDPRITFPLPGAQLLVDGESQSVALAVDGGRRPYSWVVDGRPLASRGFTRSAEWRPDSEGFATLTVTDAAGRSDAVRVRVVRRSGG